MTKKTMSISLLAENIYGMEINEEICFKTLPNCDAWGITRLQRFEATFLFLSYFGGIHVSVMDVTSDESPEMILEWLTRFLGFTADHQVYPLSKDDLAGRPNPEK